MNVTGIIAEYNPFHNGHAYQIQKAREQTNADYIIVAMSGNFVQRGAPAIIDKFSRSAMALQNGADFVFEIPAMFATGSAEYFALAGVSLLCALGCVDTLCFGCETHALPEMMQIAQLLLTEPSSFATGLSSYLKKGLSFPAARQKAAADYFLQQNQNMPDAMLNDILGLPNNILALEYLKALLRFGSFIRPHPILRQGAGYHSKELNSLYCSASALRAQLLHPSPCPDLFGFLSSYMPKNAAGHLLSSDTRFLSENDFSQALFYQLLCQKDQGYAKYADCSMELSRRILHALPEFTNYASFCETLKTKNMTYARISRMLLHILLQMDKDSQAAGKAAGYVPYLRLLGFLKKSAGLFSSFRHPKEAPMILRPAKDEAKLSISAHELFLQDVFASNLYYGILAEKSRQPQKNEYQRGVIAL